MLNKIKLLSMLSIVVLGLGGLTACNTVEGAGQDIEAAGDTIEDSARHHKNY